MRHVSLDERADVVVAVPGRAAAVAVPVLRHPTFGECVAVTRRTTVNGHTGERMTNAGDVVLFGGSVEDGETGAEAALRELCEEAGTPQLLHDDQLRVVDHLGTWVTEAGFHVDGYEVHVPESFVDAVAGDEREVAEVAYLRVKDIRAAPMVLEYHPVDPLDHSLEERSEVAFQSPTLRVAHPGSGDEWVLWGLAGSMISRWRARTDTPAR